MEELVDAINNMNNTLLYMANQLQGIQSTLDDIKGTGIYNSISDVYDKIETELNDIKGMGLYNTISDVCDKLNEVENSIGLINI